MKSPDHRYHFANEDVDELQDILIKEPGQYIPRWLNRINDWDDYDNNSLRWHIAADLLIIISELI